MKGGGSLGLSRFFEISYLPTNTWKIQGGGAVKKYTLYVIKSRYNPRYLHRYKSREGNGLLASLTNPTTGHRKLYEPIISLLFAFFPRESWYGCFDLWNISTQRYGLLEQPSLPPSIPILPFKLFLVGRWVWLFGVLRNVG